MAESTTPDFESRRTFFDGVAAMYDRARPGYPEALIDDVLSFARVGAGGRALEIGCGSGQATAQFAARGVRLVCVEPGEKLAALARANLARYPGVEVRCQTFEAWPLERGAFDLIIAALALHWVDPAVRFVKSAQALRPGGTLAFFHNNVLAGRSEADAVIRRAAGDDAPLLLPVDVQTPYNGLMKSELFGPVRRRRYRWTRDYDAQTYVELLRTQPRLLKVSGERREAFLGTVADAVRRRGGTITVHYVTELQMARQVQPLTWWGRQLKRFRRAR